jgi:hypothetical protein
VRCEYEERGTRNEERVMRVACEEENRGEGEEEEEEGEKEEKKRERAYKKEKGGENNNNGGSSSSSSNHNNNNNNSEHDNSIFIACSPCSKVTRPTRPTRQKTKLTGQHRTEHQQVSPHNCKDSTVHRHAARLLNTRIQYKQQTAHTVHMGDR